MADLEKNYQLVSNFDFTITYIPTIPLLHNSLSWLFIYAMWQEHGLIVQQLNAFINEGYMQAYFREWGNVTGCKVN